jgi:hypothetical protein
MKLQSPHLVDQFRTTTTEFMISTNSLCTNFNVFNSRLYFHICFIVVQTVPEDDQDRSKRVGVVTNCV